MLLLTEEVGELAKACRKMSRMNVSDNNKTEDPVDELTDIINMTFAVVIKHGIDIEKAFIGKNR